MVNEYSLDLLPMEILEMIFDYCNINDLSKLACTCTRINSIISNRLWYRELTNDDFIPIVTNQLEKSIQLRSSTRLSVVERHRISENWKYGRFKEKIFCKERRKYMANLILEDKTVWLSQGVNLKYLQRRKNRIYIDKNKLIARKFDSDITNLKKDGDRFILGLSDGSINMFKLFDKNHKISLKCHTKYITALDVFKPTFASSGSDDTIVKLWPYFNKIDDFIDCTNLPIQPLFIWNVRDRVCSLKYSNDGQLISIGTCAIETKIPLLIFNIERNLKIFEAEARRGAGILDSCWENENCLLTCGYDATINLWDLRTKNCVSTWDEPHNSVLYCMQTDNLYTILCGTQDCGKTTLFDKRKPYFVQCYFATTIYGKSPVNSIGFDPSILLSATDQCLNVFDFTGNNNPVKDYSCIKSIFNPYL